MKWEEALEIVVTRTRHWPYRDLCSDKNTKPPPNHRDAYRSLMLRLVGEPLPPENLITAAESIRLNRIMLACQFRSRGSTGCGCGKCALRGGVNVSHPDCFECIRTYEKEALRLACL